VSGGACLGIHSERYLSGIRLEIGWSSARSPLGTRMQHFQVISEY